MATIRLLGGFRLDIAGAKADVPVANQRLLAFLGMHGQVSRSVVAGTLWGDVTEEHALGSLRSTIWRLNRSGLRLLGGNGDLLALAPAVDVDVHDFTDTAARVLDSEREIGTHDGDRILATGELLPGWDEEWVSFERDRLFQVRLYALEALAARFTMNGQFGPALYAGLESVRLDPLRESAHRAVVAVHLAENNMAEALRRYQFFRDLVRDELGIDPSSQFTEMLPGQILWLAGTPARSHDTTRART